MMLPLGGGNAVPALPAGITSAFIRSDRGPSLRKVLSVELARAAILPAPHLPLETQALIETASRSSRPIARAEGHGRKLSKLQR